MTGPIRPPETAEQFALRTADALSASLNMDRTLARVVDLCVPRLGVWASVSLTDGVDVRQATTGSDGAATDVTVKLARSLDSLPALIDDRDAATVRTADERLLAALGADDRVRADLLAAGAVVSIVGMETPRVQSLLAVAGPVPADPTDLAGLARRGGRALTAAGMYTERGRLASALRTSLEPKPLPLIDGVDLGAAYRPAQESTQIGGDFYDVTMRADGWWALSVGDVCGKGVEAAVLTGQVRQSIRTASMIDLGPADALKLVNDTMLTDSDGDFVTVAYAMLQPRDGAIRMRLTTGGHPAPLVLSDGHVRELAVGGTLIGVLPEVTFREAELDLAAGDVMAFYTDGATEAHGADGMLGVERLADVLSDSAGLPAQVIADRLMQRVADHLDGRRHDDIAFVVLGCRS